LTLNVGFQVIRHVTTREYLPMATLELASGGEVTNHLDGQATSRKQGKGRENPTGA